VSCVLKFDFEGRGGAKIAWPRRAKGGAQILCEIPRPILHEWSYTRNAARPFGVLQMLVDLADLIYWFGCIVAAVILGIGVFSYWFGQGGLSVLGSWAALAAILWLVGYAIRYILAGRL
jgi:hypothetical protein